MSNDKTSRSQHERHLRKQVERRPKHKDKYSDEAFEDELRRLARMVNSRRNE